MTPSVHSVAQSVKPGDFAAADSLARRQLAQLSGCAPELVFYLGTYEGHWVWSGLRETDLRLWLAREGGMFE